jgi:tRNA dimethylallyltransferase
VTRAAVSDVPRAAPRDVAVPRAVVGPTASGKTAASVELARRLGAEVVLVDSMTVYRGMDVGTAKPTTDERASIRHHLVDVADPVDRFSVARFQRLAAEALTGIRRRGHAPLLVGGSGLYFRAVVDELEFPGTDAAVRTGLDGEAAVLGPERLHARLAAFDPAAAAKIEPFNARRTVRALEVAAVTGRPFSSFAASWASYPHDRVRAAGILIPAAVLRGRIEARVESQLRAGLIEEVRALLEGGAGPFFTASQAIGYAEVAEHLAGRIGLDEARQRIVRRSRALARRQMAWFRRDPRIRWFETGADGAAGIVDELEEYLRA